MCVCVSWDVCVCVCVCVCVAELPDMLLLRDTLLVTKDLLRP